MATDFPGIQAAGDATRRYDAGGIHNFTSVAFVNADGNPKQIDLGYVARRIEVVNETDNIVWKKHHLMAAANAVKVTSSAQAIDTGGHITIIDEKSGKTGVILDATVVPSGKNVSVQIFGD